MARPKKALDTALRKKLESYVHEDSDYWSFRGKATRNHAHAYLQYPAMMVPGMLGELIEALTRVVPSIRTVFDPFMGSGTTMTEAMLRGLDFAGQDINPLAFLICAVKRGPFFYEALGAKSDALSRRIERTTGKAVDVDFRNLCKWFRDDVAESLSQLRRAICREPSKWARRFFWVALAETIRQRPERGRFPFAALASQHPELLSEYVASGLGFRSRLTAHAR